MLHKKSCSTKVLESDQMELVTVQLMQLRPLSSHQQLTIVCVICEKYGSKKVLLEKLGVGTKIESLKGSDNAQRRVCIFCGICLHQQKCTSIKNWSETSLKQREDIAVVG